MSPEKTQAQYELRKRAEAMEDTRRRITEAAMELHGTLGPARTTISAVAERAGVQRHTVYRHFPTEDELFAACSGTSRPAPVAGPGALARDRRPRRAAAHRARRALRLVRGDRGDVDERAARRDARRRARRGAGAAARLPRRRGSALAAGWGARGRRRAMLLAAARHAVDFSTWRSLAQHGALSRRHAIDLASGMVDRAVGDHR